MKSIARTATALLVAAGLAGCNGIGDGNTVQSISVVILPNDTFEQGVMLDRDLPTERYRMYDCFCSNITALATFTDDTAADFSNRVTFTSSDETVVDVLNVEETDDEACPLAQNAAGMLIPRGTGTAVITATFGPLSAQMTIEVADASNGTYALVAAPPADPANTNVAVGAQLPLRVTATLDGRPRTLNRNVLEWTFDEDVDADFASVDAIGVVRGVAATGASPKTARASFGACTDVSPTAVVNVGEILGPLTLEREAPDFAFDDLLAVESDEELVATAQLDFDGDASADGEQLLSQLIALSYTDACTLREYDATVPTNNCRETNTTCGPEVVPVCTTGSLQTCEADMTPCRTLGSPILRGTFAPNQIVAFNDYGTPTNFTATFPEARGEETTLAAAIDGVATTLEVDELSGYPAAFPWFAVIDAAGTREDVRVTAVDGTTLTVVRGVGGTSAAAHAAGATFEQRSVSSAPTLDITAKQGTLTTVAIDPPGTLAPLGTLQLRAEGTFVDVASASRQQRVTRLLAPASREEAPTVDWTSSDTTVATVSVNNGVMTSRTACGGRTTIRARATTSADETTAEFDPDSTADEDACLATDPLCDQVEVCIVTPDPLPAGTTCETTTTCP
jgi:hypothetical protein